jgi:hypothetical protein
MQSATIQPKTARPPVRPLERRVPMPMTQPRNSWLPGWLGRRKPTTYQRCLAIHIYFAAPRSALS